MKVCIWQWCPGQLGTTLCRDYWFQYILFKKYLVHLMMFLLYTAWYILRAVRLFQLLILRSGMLQHMFRFKFISQISNPLLFQSLKKNRFTFVCRLVHQAQMNLNLASEYLYPLWWWGNINLAIPPPWSKYQGEYWQCITYIRQYRVSEYKTGPIRTTLTANEAVDAGRNGSNSTLFWLIATWCSPCNLSDGPQT